MLVTIHPGLQSISIRTNSSIGKLPFDCRLIAVDVEKPTDHLKGLDRINLLNVHLDELDQAVLVKIANEVVDKVEAIAGDNEWELVGELGFFEEILDLLRIIEVTSPTDTLNLADLTSASGGPDVLEVNFGTPAEVDNRAKIIVLR